MLKVSCLDAIIYFRCVYFPFKHYLQLSFFLFSVPIVYSLTICRSN